MNIRIAKPCKIPPSTIQVQDNNFYCPKCAKNIIDFTRCSPEEVQEHLEQNSEQKVCGLMNRRQIPNEKTNWRAKIIYRYDLLKNSHKKHLFTTLYAGVLYVILCLSNNFQAQAQEAEKPKKTNSIEKDAINNSENYFGEMPISASYPNGINAFRKTIQEKLEKSIPQNEKMNEKVNIKIFIDAKGKIEKIDFVNFQPAEKIQRLIEDILYKEVELFSPALDAKGKPIKSYKILPIAI